ncbi:MAG: radical SAM protein [Nitrospiraceae bacterium]|nr:radical SAM protein [Nitrospiraceae bacterium]
MFVDSADGSQFSSGLLGSWAKMQFGVSYISSMLKAHGHETKLLVLSSGNLKKSARLIGSYMEEFGPGVVCFTAVFSQYSFVEKAAALARRDWPGRYYAIGGVHATLNPEDVIRGPFDVLCVGEGEYPILELCTRLDAGHEPGGIANLWLKSPGGEISRTEARDFIRDLDRLPFPDREMWRPWIKDDPNDETVVLVGRGCPFDCTYCSNHAIRRVAGGRYVRMRSPENIIREISSVYHSGPQRRIFLEAESIALEKQWTFDLCGKLAAFNRSIGNAVSYGCNFRVSRQSVDDDLFAAFEAANFKSINIGLESGSERVRREVLKRNYTNDEFLGAAAMARRHGMMVNVYNLIGIPGESEIDHMETVRINRLCQPDNLCTSIFFPYPGTELYRTCLREGLIKDSVSTTTRERRTAVLDLPGFSGGRIRRAYRLFERRVYKGRFPWWKDFLRALYGRMPSRPRSALSRAMGRVPGVRVLRETLKRKLFAPEGKGKTA